MPPKKAKSGPKQPAIYRQKRHNRQDTAFTIIDGKRIHLGIFGTLDADIYIWPKWNRYGTGRQAGYANYRRAESGGSVGTGSIDGSQL